MTNTINNVLRELLERICTMNFMGLDIDNEVAEIRKFLSCASPVPIKELSASAKVKEYEDVDGDTQYAIYFTKQKMPHGTELVRLSDAQAIIDGLRGEVDRLQMQLAACGVVALANTIESAGEARQMHPDYMSASCSDVAGAVDREIALRTERDQQAQRIGELEGLLRDVAGMFRGPGIEGGPLTKLRRRIDAALSAGKEQQ